MRNSRLKKFFLISSMLAIFGISLSLTYSWLIKIEVIPNNTIGKTRSSYFGGGTGTVSSPYIIFKPNHFFNLSYLQNLGIFTSKTYFIVTNDIDFNDALPRHRVIQPIGTTQYPFIGEFIGNSKKISFYTVDGTGYQDIGTFGMVGATGKITNLFLESPNIISYHEPTSSEITSFHEHKGSKTVVDGYIAGHIVKDAVVENVFVVTPSDSEAPKPKIQSLSNKTLNSSQSGLIGFSENFNSIIPDESYNFKLEGSTSTYAIRDFVNDFGSSYRIRGSGDLLNEAFTSSGNYIIAIKQGYSFSDMKIYPSNGSSNDWKYLYDVMLEKDALNPNKDYVIDNFRRENIDIIGEVQFNKKNNDPNPYKIIVLGTDYYTVPTVNSTFIPSTYRYGILLYVKPALNPDNLGSMIYRYENYNEGKNISYNVGWTAGGAYNDGAMAVRQIITTPGSTGYMKASQSFTAVRVNRETGEMTVVDASKTIPDYYVFLLTLTNGSQSMQSFEFSYQATDSSNVGDLGKVDFITSSEIDTVKTYLASENGTYPFSFYTFSYDISGDHGLDISAYKTAYNPVTGQGTYELDFSHLFSPTSPTLSFFNILISNSKGHTVVIKNNNKTKTTSNTIISIRVEKAGVYIDGVLLE